MTDSARSAYRVAITDGKTDLLTHECSETDDHWWVALYLPEGKTLRIMHGIGGPVVASFVVPKPHYRVLWMRSVPPPDSGASSAEEH